MQFFEWSDFVQFFCELFSRGVGNTLEAQQQFYFMKLLVGVSVGGALFLACLILGGIGLAKMAKKEGKKHRFLAFIPLLNTFYMGHVAGGARFFGQKMKRAGLYAALIELVYCTAAVLILISEFVFLPYLTLQPGTDAFTGAETLDAVISYEAIPLQYRWLYRAVYGSSGLGIGWLTVVRYLLLLLLIVFLCVILFALFKKYYPKNPALMTALCAVFPVRDIAFFSLRNRTPIDYDAYMKKRMEEYMRQRQYGPYGTYGGTEAPPRQEPQEPFSDFEDKKGGGSPNPPPDDNPFSDF